MISILKIKNADGTWQTVPAIKGDKGDKGDTGAKGADGAAGANGKDGKDGVTPVKGVDYYTAAEKQELVNQVIAALPLAEEVAY